MTQGVARLKELLLDTERRELGALTQRLDAVFEQAGTQERLERSVATVLEGALREAEVAKHQEVASALSPLVIDTVRQQIRTMASEIGDLLYPQVGRMVANYVASAIRDMMTKVNRRIGSGLSPKSWWIKAKSRFTGTSEAELWLAEMNALRLDELYLIRRGSGELIQHWEAVGAGEVGGRPVAHQGNGFDTGDAGSNRDAVVSAFLTAINDFSREAFASSEGGLQSLDVQSHRIYLRSSPGYLLAAKCTGFPTSETERLLDREFIEAIERHRTVLDRAVNGAPSAETRAVLPALGERLAGALGSAEEMVAARRPNYAKWLLVLLAAGLISWLSWDKWQTYRTEEARAAVEAVLSSSVMGSYVSTVEVERGGGVVRLKGLAPTREDKEALLGTLRGTVTSSRIEDRIEVLPEKSDDGLNSLKISVADARAAASIAAAHRALVLAKSKAQSTADAVARLTDETGDGRVRGTIETAGRKLTAASSEIDAVTAILARATPRQNLEAEHPRLAALARMVQSVHADLAGVRGARAEALPAHSPVLDEPFAPIRSEADAILASVDSLAGEVGAVERFLLRKTIADLVNQRRLTPRQELESWSRAHGVFFSAETTYRDDAQTGRTLAELASLIQKSGAIVRVIGYTDDAGTVQRNTTIAIDRANKVRQALIDLGVPDAGLVAIGRTTGPNVSQFVGVSSPNRRVEFEVAFEQEINGG